MNLQISNIYVYMYVYMTWKPAVLTENLYAIYHLIRIMLLKTYLSLTIFEGNKWSLQPKKALWDEYKELQNYKTIKNLTFFQQNYIILVWN